MDRPNRPSASSAPDVPRRSFLASAVAALGAPVFLNRFSTSTPQPLTSTAAVSTRTLQQEIEPIAGAVNHFFITGQQTTVSVSANETDFIKNLHVLMDLRGQAGIESSHKHKVNFIDQNGHARYTLEITPGYYGIASMNLIDNDFDMSTVEPGSEYFGTDYIVSGTPYFQSLNSESLGFDFTIDLAKTTDGYQLAIYWREFDPNVRGGSSEDPESTIEFFPIRTMDVETIASVEFESTIAWGDADKFRIVSSNAQTDSGHGTLMLIVENFEALDLQNQRTVPNNRGVIEINTSGGTEVRDMEAEDAYLSGDKSGVLVATPYATQVHCYKDRIDEYGTGISRSDEVPERTVDFKESSARFTFETDYGLEIVMGKFLGIKELGDSLAIVSNGSANGRDVLTWIQPNLHAIATYDVALLPDLFEKVLRDEDLFMKQDTASGEVVVNPINLSLMIRDTGALSIHLTQNLSTENEVVYIAQDIMGSDILRGQVELSPAFDLTKPIQAVVRDNSRQAWEAEQFTDVRIDEIPHKEQVWPHYEIADLQLCEPYLSPVSYTDPPSIERQVTRI